MVKVLLEAGAKKELKTSPGRTALDIAKAERSEEHREIVKILEFKKILWQWNQSVFLTMFYNVLFDFISN